MITYSCGCSVETDSTSYINTSFTPDMYKQFLIASLLAGDNCMDTDDFNDYLDTIWDMLQFQGGCDLELRYLLTRLELIKILMGCKVYDVDRSDSVSESNSRSELDITQDGESQSQQSGFNSAYADLIGEQRYNDFADSTLRAESQRTAYSESHDESHHRMDDTGSGASNSDTTGNRASDSFREATDHSESTSTTSRDGARRGYNYQHSASKTNGDGINLGALGWGRTGTKNTWDQIMRTDTYDAGSTDRHGFSTREIDAWSKSSNTMQRVSSSYFNALVDDRTWGASTAKAEDHQRSQSDSNSHAEGLGQSAAESEARSKGVTQGLSQSKSKSITERDGKRSSYSLSDTVYANQRFQALKKLYDNTLSLITYKRKQISGRRGVSIGYILFCDPCGYVPGISGDIARARLCLPMPCPSCCESLVAHS